MLTSKFEAGSQQLSQTISRTRKSKVDAVKILSWWKYKNCLFILAHSAIALTKTAYICDLRWEKQAHCPARLTRNTAFCSICLSTYTPRVAKLEQKEQKEWLRSVIFGILEPQLCSALSVWTAGANIYPLWALLSQKDQKERLHSVIFGILEP